MLLYCQTPHCNVFNYNNSIFLSTYDAQSIKLSHEHYYSGNYISFAFDTYPDGLIKSSTGLIDSSYSISSTTFNLTKGSLTGKINSIFTSF